MKVSTLSAAAFFLLSSLGNVQCIDDQTCDASIESCIDPAASNTLSQESPAKGFTVKHFPQKKDTGVDVPILRLAASIAGQIYASSFPGDFNLSTPEVDPQVLKVDTHGDESIVTPDFAMVVADKTMILGWQGSTYIMDFIIDVAFTPISNKRWSHISKDLQIHSGFQSIIENDLTRHEDEIVATMKENGITELVTTGHSLGGALAQTAQFFIEAEMMRDGSIWKQYSDATPGFKTKTVAFSAPMSIVNNANSDDEKVNEFLKKIDENSCNVIYSTDIVPRGFSHLDFIDDSILEAMSDAADALDDRGFIASIGAGWFGIKKKVASAYEEKVKDGQRALFKVASKYRHYGKIISYRNDAEEPEIYRDFTPEEVAEGLDQAGIGRFGDIQWEETPDVIGRIMHDHNFSVRGPGLAYNIPEDIITASLHYQHEVSILNGKNNVGEPIEVNGWEDCLNKAKEHLVAAHMGAVVEWDNKDDMHEGKGVMYVKKDLPKDSKKANKKTSGFFAGKNKRTTLWRAPGSLMDMVETGEIV